MFRLLAPFIALVLAQAGVSAQQAVRALADLPGDVQFGLHIEGGWALVQQNAELAARLRAWGLAEETLPAFKELAERLDEPPAIAFERLLGRRATLTVRLVGDSLHWVVLSEVDRETAAALPLQLKAQPRRVASTLAVQALERRSFDFTVSPGNPTTNTAWIVLGPERASALFDAAVGGLMGVPGGGERLGRGAAAPVFADRQSARMAVFYQDVDGPGALLAWAGRDQDSWDIGVRASTSEAWLAGLGIEADPGEPRNVTWSVFDRGPQPVDAEAEEIRGSSRLVIAATTGITPPPATALALHRLKPSPSTDDRLLWIGRCRPQAMAEQIAQSSVAGADRAKPSGLVLTGLETIDHVQWRVWEASGQLRAQIRLKLAESPAQ